MRLIQSLKQLGLGIRTKVLQLSKGYALKSFSLGALALMVLILGNCTNGGPVSYQVILLEFEDGIAPLHPVEAYADMLSGGPGVYRTSPLGRPVLASVWEWYDAISGSRTQVQFNILGKFVSPVSLATIRARDLDGTEWWHHGLTKAAIAAARAENKGPAGSPQLIVLHNSIYGDWNAGAITSRGIDPRANAMGLHDIPPIGSLVHEIGHSVYRQPDRYGYYWGSLRGWDNMADHYGDFPAGYSSHGLLQAGFAQWGEWITQAAGASMVREFLPLAMQDEIPRFQSEIDPGPSGSPSFFTFEVRRNLGPETLAELPAQGALLFESDSSVKTNYLPEASPSPRVADFKRFRAANSLFQVGTHTDNFVDWALPNSAGDTAFDCSTLGTSLNSLGECHWEFHEIEHLETVTRFKATYHPMILPPTPQNDGTLTFALPYTFEHGARLYLKMRSAAHFQWTIEDADHRPLQTGTTLLGADAKSRLRHHVLTLDSAANQDGVTVVFKSLDSSELLSKFEKVTYVERPLLKPKTTTTPQVLQKSATLISGQTWLNPAGIALAGAEGVDSVFVMKPYNPGASSIRGFHRFTLGWDASAQGTSSLEDLTIRLCVPLQVGSLPATRHCVNRGRGLYDSSRAEPIVFTAAIDAQPGYEVEIIRTRTAVAAPLHVLSVDFVPYPVLR